MAKGFIIWIETKYYNRNAFLKKIDDELSAVSVRNGRRKHVLPGD